MTDVFTLLDKYPIGASMTAVTSAALTMPIEDVVTLRKSIGKELAEPLPQTMPSIDDVIVEHTTRHTFLNMALAIDVILAHRLSDERYSTAVLIEESSDLPDELGTDTGGVVLVDLESILARMIN